MPIYQTRCRCCGHQSDQYARVSARNRIRCEACGGRTEITFDGVRVANGNREFRGANQTSKCEQWVPGDVPYARKLLGTLGSCIQNDGTVKFKDRGEQRRYVRELAKHEARAKARQD